MTASPDNRGSPIQRLPLLYREEKSIIQPHALRLEPIAAPPQSGNAYYLDGIKHKLPAPKTLRPFVDTYAGTIDSWPAHSSGAASSMQISLSKNKELILADEEKMGKPQLTPKPRFLENLESFLKKELKALGVTKVEANELRLQAHREVFEYLIEDFKTYKPLLSSIKNEYEMMLAHQRELIRRLEPLKQMLVTVSEQCEQKIVRQRDEEKQEVVDLKRENARLYKAIDATRGDQASLQTQVDRLQQKLSEQYERYRDEADARKLLVSDINDLRYQQEDLLMQQAQQSSQDKADDPVLMKIALKKARESEKDATQRLNEMIANYGDVIPRRDFESLEKRHRELQEKMDTRDRDYGVLRVEHDTLLEVHKQVVKQRDDIFQEAEGLREAATPRPRWARCADFVRGGAQRWQEVAKDRSSDELVDVLISELTGGAVGAPEGSSEEYFDGQGISAIVAPYLRYEGQVRNRHLGKRDVALVVKDVWRERSVAESERAPGTDSLSGMGEFFNDYLLKHFPVRQMAVEWAYNIHDACRRFALDDRLALFYGVLTGEIQEAVYFSQLQVIGRLLKHLKAKADELGNADQIAKPAFQAALSEFFGSSKSEADVRRLAAAAEAELDATDIDMLDYANLFLEDDEGKFGQFVDEMLHQTHEEKSRYVEELKAAFGETTQIGPDDFRQALLAVDATIGAEQLDVLLCWAYRVGDKEQLGSVQPLDAESAVRRVLGADVWQSGAARP